MKCLIMQPFYLGLTDRVHSSTLFASAPYTTTLCGASFSSGSPKMLTGHLGLLAM